MKDVTNQRFKAVLGLCITSISFVSVLVIFGLKEQSYYTVKAIECFSICISISVAFQILNELCLSAKNKHFIKIPRIMANFSLLIFVGFLIGIYYVFKHISCDSASYFMIT